MRIGVDHTDQIKRILRGKFNRLATIAPLQRRHVNQTTISLSLSLSRFSIASSLTISFAFDSKFIGHLQASQAFCRPPCLAVLLFRCHANKSRYLHPQPTKLTLVAEIEFAANHLSPFVVTFCSKALTVPL
jgi:hypothetical protein